MSSRFPPSRAAGGLPMGPNGLPAPVDNSKRDGPWKCDVCGQGYWNPTDLNLHRTKRHEQGDMSGSTMTAAQAASVMGGGPGRQALAMTTPPPTRQANAPPPQPQAQAPPSSSMMMSGVRRVRATADFDAEVADDLTFRTGDVMSVLETFDGWLKCELQGRIGLVPDTLVVNVADAPAAAAPPVLSPRGLASSLSSRGLPPPIAGVPMSMPQPPPPIAAPAASPPMRSPLAASASMRGLPPSIAAPQQAPPAVLTASASMRGGMAPGAVPQTVAAAAAVPPGQSPFVGRQVRAIARFDQQVPEDLPFASKDVLNVLADMGGGWLRAELNGRVGQIPASYVVDAGAASTSTAPKQAEVSWQPLTSGILFQPIAATDARGNDPCERCKMRKVRARVKLEDLTLLLCKQCFPEHDHQLLTNRGFLFLDEVEAYRDAHGGSLAGLLVASFDASTRAIVYKEPRALVVNAPGADVVELSDSDEHCRWAADSDLFGDAALPAAARALSVCATRTHELFVAADDECFAKRTVQSLIADPALAALRLLAAPSSGSVGAACELPAAVRALAGGNDALLLELLGAVLAGGGAGSASVVERLARLGLRDALAVRALLDGGERLPAWAWQLDAAALRHVVRGAQAEQPHAERLLLTASAAVRDEWMRVLLHAGFAATFSLHRKATAAAPLVWAVAYSDDADAVEPTLRLACAPGKRAHADVVVEHAKVPRRTWCFDVDGGFVIVRRAQRIAAAQFSAIVDAQRALAAATNALRSAADECARVAAQAAVDAALEAERAALAPRDDAVGDGGAWVVVKASRATVQGNCTLQAQEMDQLAEQSKRLASVATGKAAKDGKYPFSLRPPPTSVLKPYILIASQPGDALAWVDAIRASVNGAVVDPQTDQPWRTGWLVKKGQKRWFALDVKGQALYWFNKETSLAKDDRGLVKGFKNLAPLAVYRFADLQDDGTAGGAAPAALERTISHFGGGSISGADGLNGERMTSESDQPVLIQVLCHGERKRIPLHPRMSVSDAIAAIGAKFTFVNTEGYQLCMGVEATVLKTDSLLWRYKLSADDELELRAPLRSGTIRSQHGDVAALLRRPWGVASLGPGYRTNEDRITGLRQQVDELAACINKTRAQVGYSQTPEAQETEMALQQLQQVQMSIENDIRSLAAGGGGAPPPPGPPVSTPSFRGAPTMAPMRSMPALPTPIAGVPPPPPIAPVEDLPPLQRQPSVKPLPKLPPALTNSASGRGPPPGRQAAALPPPVQQQQQPLPPSLSPPPMRAREAPARLPAGPGRDAAQLRKASEAAMNRPLPTMVPAVPSGQAPAESGLGEEARRLAEMEARLAAQEAALAAQEAELAAERGRLAQIRKAQQRLTMTVTASLMDDEDNAADAAQMGLSSTAAKPMPLPPAPASRPICMMTCEYDYVAEEERELSITAGEDLFILRKNEATGWYLAERASDRKQTGWVPSTLIGRERAV